MVEPSAQFWDYDRILLVYSFYQEYLLVVFHISQAIHIPSLSLYSTIFFMYPCTGLASVSLWQLLGAPT